MLDKTIHNFEGLRTARLNLIQVEFIWPLQDRLHRGSLSSVVLLHYVKVEQ